MFTRITTEKVTNNQKRIGKLRTHSVQIQNNFFSPNTMLRVMKIEKEISKLKTNNIENKQ